ncbi:MAG: hypothetical protein WC342_00080 [Methanoregula sp.]|jgi:hypothetical protein
MNSEIDPDEAIKKIDIYLEEIDTLLEESYSQGEGAKKRLNTKIRGFLRGTFKDDEAKLRDLETDRFSQVALEKTKQKKFVADLEIMKNHLVAYKEELELFSSSRKRKSQSLEQPDSSFKRDSKEQKRYSVEEIRLGGIGGIILSIIMAAMAYTLYPNILSVSFLGIFSLAFGILGIGCFVKPDEFGPVLLLWFERIGKANTGEQGKIEQKQRNPRNSPQIINKGGNVTVNIGEKSKKPSVEDEE